MICAYLFAFYGKVTPHAWSSTQPNGGCPSSLSSHLKHHLPTGEVLRVELQDFSTVLFGAELQIPHPLYSDEAVQSYELYAYIGGKWMRFTTSLSGLVLGNRFVPAQIVMQLNQPIAFFDAFAVDTTGALSESIRAVPFAHKYSLAKELEKTPLSDEVRLTVKQALRRRSWYGPEFGMPHLQNLTTLFDLAPYGACVAQYKGASGNHAPGDVKLVISEEQLQRITSAPSTEAWSP